TASVADQNGGAVAGVRVDFSVSGANTASGFATTETDGTAPFCYTGTSTGTDTITASVGTVSDTATNEQRPRETKFAAFQARVQVKPAAEELEVQGSFSLGSGSDGIDPVNEPLTLKIGDFLLNVPAGTFRLEAPSGVGFEKTINGRKVEA